MNECEQVLFNILNDTIPDTVTDIVIDYYDLEIRPRYHFKHARYTVLEFLVCNHSSSLRDVFLWDSESCSFKKSTHALLKLTLKIIRDVLDDLRQHTRNQWDNQRYKKEQEFAELLNIDTRELVNNPLEYILSDSKDMDIKNILVNIAKRRMEHANTNP